MLELEPAQLSVLGSRVRMQVFDCLSRWGPQSVRELAARLQRPANGLYHHVAALEHAGLVRLDAVRPGRRRSERVYAMAAEQISSRQAARSEGGRAALAKVGHRIVSSAARSVATALRSGRAVTEGAGRNTAIRHLHLRLSQQSLSELNRAVDALVQRAQRASLSATALAADEPIAGVDLTIVLSPYGRGSA